MKNGNERITSKTQFRELRQAGGCQGHTCFCATAVDWALGYFVNKVGETRIGKFNDKRKI